MKLSVKSTRPLLSWICCQRSLAGGLVLVGAAAVVVTVVMLVDKVVDEAVDEVHPRCRHLDAHLTRPARR